MDHPNLPTELRPNYQIELSLPSGTLVHLPKCKPALKKWRGPPLPFSFGRKPVLEYGGQPLFAELVILRILERHGWQGAWVETYGGLHFLRTMPTEWKLNAEHVALPPDKEVRLNEILSRVSPKASFDIYAWKDEEILFCEAKRSRKDKITQGQLRFVEAALSGGLHVSSLVVVEWSEISG